MVPSAPGLSELDVLKQIAANTAGSGGSPGTVTDSDLNTAIAGLRAEAPATLADVGGITSRPYVLLLAGQSNAIGRDNLGDKTNPPNTLILNDFLVGSALVPAMFGTAPLVPGSTPDVACNNQGVHFCNQLRMSGMIPALRPIVIITNAMGGEPISQWVGSGTASPYWVDLLASLVIVEAAYPNFTIDHVLWSQGEADSPAGGFATNASKSLYLQAFKTLLVQWRALPQWASTTTVSVTELGPFTDNTQQDRNDAIRTMKAGMFDPMVTMVSGSGLVESLQAPPFHYDGNSLVTLGHRHFEAWRHARVNGSYSDHSHSSANTGGAEVIPDWLIATASTTLSVTTDNFKSGGCYIDATATPAATIVLPQAKWLPGGVAMLNVATNTIVQSVSNIQTTSNTAVTHTIPAGFYRAVSVPTSNTWMLESIWPSVGSVAMSYSQLASAPVTLTNQECTFSQFFLNGNTSLTLPLPNNGNVIVVYNGSTAASTIATADPTGIILPAGAVFKETVSYAVQPSAFLMLISVKGHWFLVYDSSTAARIQVGPTASRPVGLGAADAGLQYFDSTLGKPVWWAGANWHDATGTGA